MRGVVARESIDQRRNQVQALAMRGDREGLTAFLGDAAASVRRWVVVALCSQWSDRGVVEVLRKALGDGDASVRIAAATGLGRLGAGECWGEIARLASSSLWRERLAALEALGKLGEAASRVTLRSALNDRVPVVVEAAIEGLVRLGERDAGPLMPLLSSPDANVRASCARALGVPGAGRDAVNGLVGLLRDDSWMVREAAARGLGALGAPEAASALNGVAKSDRSEKVRQGAAWACERLGAPALSRSEGATSPTR